MSGSGISWAICKSAPRSRETTTPASHHSDNPLKWGKCTEHNLQFTMIWSKSAYCTGPWPSQDLAWASHKLNPALETVVTVMVKSVYIELVLSWPCVNAWWWWCSYESGSEKSDRVSKACRQIQLTHHSKPAYLLNVSVAYDILCQIKGIYAKSVFSFLRQLSTWHCPRLLLSARCAAAPLLNAGRAEIDWSSS